MKSPTWQHTCGQIAKVAGQLLAEKIAETQEEAAEMACRIVTGESLEAFSVRP